MVPRSSRSAHRWDSSSSVGTVTDSQTIYSLESSILQAPPKNQDANEYTVFEFRDAIIYGNDNEQSEESSLQNPLHVALNGPFTARGTLVVEDRDQQRRVLSRQKQIQLEIRSVHRFSIALSDTKQPVIWILGLRGAWYEITPAPAFRQIYEDMREAVILYYCILDFYQPALGNHRRNAKKSHLPRLLLQYAAEAGDGLTYEDALERLDKHAGFLFTHFLGEEYVMNDDPDGELVAWKDTELFRWLQERNPVLFRKIQSKPQVLPNLSTRDAKSHPLPPHLLPSTSRDVSTTPPKRSRKLREAFSAVASSQTQSSRSSTEQSGNMELDKGPARSSRSPPLPESTIFDQAAPTDPTGYGQACYERLAQAILELVGPVFAKRPQSELGFRTLSNKIYFKYKFPEFRAEKGLQRPSGSHAWGVCELLRFNAVFLLADERLAAMLGHTAFWVSLHEKSTEPFRPVVLKPSDFPYLLVPRKKTTRTTESAPIRHHGKSPQVSTPRGPVNDDAAPSGKRPRGRPQKSVLKIAPASRKRPHSDLEYADDTFYGDASHHFEDEDDSTNDLANDLTPLDRSATLVQTADETPPVTDADVAEAFELTIRSEKGGTLPQDGWVRVEDEKMWKCKEDECGFVVRGEPDADAQRRVEWHLREHQKKSDMAALVWAERRAHLPVDHLLQKILERREQEQEEKARRESGEIQPIKRRLFV